MNVLRFSCFTQLVHHVSRCDIQRRRCRDIISWINHPFIVISWIWSLISFFSFYRKRRRRLVSFILRSLSQFNILVKLLSKTSNDYYYHLKKMSHGWRESESRPMHGNQSFMTSVDDTQFASFILFLSLLSSKGNLSCHDSLSFGDQSTFSTSTILPSAVSFVSLQKVLKSNSKLN